MSLVEQKKSRRSMVLLLLVFIVPIVLAKLALNQEWFDYGVTNQGQLIEGELHISQLDLTQEQYQKQWLIIYTLPEQCPASCEQLLQGINNTYRALGREMPRVTPILLTRNTTDVKQLEMAKNLGWAVSPFSDNAQKHLQDSQVFIADPLGNVVLTHIPPVENEELPLFGKAILADLKKLLKYSRIG